MRENFKKHDIHIKPKSYKFGFLRELSFNKIIGEIKFLEKVGTYHFSTIIKGLIKFISFLAKSPRRKALWNNQHHAHVAVSYLQGPVNRTAYHTTLRKERPTMAKRPGKQRKIKLRWG